MSFGLSPEVMNEFWTNLPATIAAIGSIIAVILAHRKSSQQRDAAKKETVDQFKQQNLKLDSASDKLDNASVKLNDIQETSNGTLATALRRIEDLELIVTELRRGKEDNA